MFKFTRMDLIEGIFSHPERYKICYGVCIENSDIYQVKDYQKYELGDISEKNFKKDIKTLDCNSYLLETYDNQDNALSRLRKYKSRLFFAPTPRGDSHLQAQEVAAEFLIYHKENHSETLVYRELIAVAPLDDISKLLYRRFYNE